MEKQSLLTTNKLEILGDFQQRIPQYGNGVLFIHVSWSRFFRNQDRLSETRVHKDLGEALQGADAVILAVRHEAYLALEPEDVVKLAGRTVAVIDCFGMLNDANIQRYFELGCEVKGMGRGHVKRIKDRVKLR